MTIATREEILARIFETLSSISGIVTCCRNQVLLEYPELPAIIMLDGREDIATPDIVQNKSVRMPPAVMRLQPVIIFGVKRRDTTANLTVNGVDAPLGEEVNHWRDMILAAITGDLTLTSMLTAHGQIHYRGMETDMTFGGSVQGEARLFIDFYYLWAPPS